jgi:hypothetical protein
MAAAEEEEEEEVHSPQAHSDLGSMLCRQAAPVDRPMAALIHVCDFFFFFFVFFHDLFAVWDFLKLLSWSFP